MLSKIKNSTHLPYTFKEVLVEYNIHNPAISCVFLQEIVENVLAITKPSKTIMYYYVPEISILSKVQVSLVIVLGLELILINDYILKTRSTHTVTVTRKPYHIGIGYCWTLPVMHAPPSGFAALAKR